MSETAVSYAFEQLEPSNPPPRDAPARIIAQATAEAQSIREQARAEGHAEGHGAGREEGLAEMRSVAHTFTQALEGIEAVRGEVVAAVEVDAIELALALAGKILAGALQARPEMVLEVVQGALRRINDRRRITVLVNPADLETMKSSIDEVAVQGSGVELCELQADERVGVGGAIVRTAEGEVDASVQTQLERAREVLSASLQAGERGA